MKKNNIRGRCILCVGIGIVFSLPPLILRHGMGFVCLFTSLIVDRYHPWTNAQPWTNVERSASNFWEWSIHISFTVSRWILEYDFCVIRYYHYWGENMLANERRIFWNNSAVSRFRHLLSITSMPVENRKRALKINQRQRRSVFSWFRRTDIGSIQLKWCCSKLRISSPCRLSAYFIESSVAQRAAHNAMFAARN